MTGVYTERGALREQIAAISRAAGERKAPRRFTILRGSYFSI
jgi:hypothetical protein